MSYSIVESFDLPSKGIFYNNVNTTVKLRAMTTLDEMRRLTKSERKYKSICDTIDACMTENIGISAYDMCFGDLYFLIFKLRTITYGPDYNVTISCPYCGKTSQDTINLDNLEVKTTNEQELKDLLTITLPRSGKIIKIKPNTPRLADNAELEAREMMRNFPDSDLDFNMLTSIKSIIDEVDGEKLRNDLLIEFVKTLNMADTNLIIGTSDKITEAIGYSNKIWYTCPKCGLPYPSAFQINGEFFRPRVG